MASSPTVDFYFDFSSPYSYIATHKINPLANSYGVEVNWKPFLLGAIFKITGAAPLTGAHAWRSSYSAVDFERSAHVHGLPFKMPSKFPQIGVTASRCTLWIKQEFGAAKGADFAKGVFHLLFVEDGDINDLSALSAIATRLGCNAQAMQAAIQTSEVKALLIATTDEATKGEVFGAPTFVFEGERFWGVDRLNHLEYTFKKQFGGKGIKTLVDQAMSEVKTLTLDEARALHGNPNTVFVDIRDPRELEREGVIPGALHAPRGMVEFWVDPKSPYYKPSFVADKQYVFFCAAGWRSALTTQTVKAMSVLPNIAHIEGGFEAWKKSGAPIAEKASK